MNTLNNKIVNKRAKDPFDILIFEKGLRIKTVMIDKQLDLLVLILNNGKILKSRISYHPKLSKASEKQLNSWRLISGGVGICWDELNEDLSVKGFIKSTALNSALHNLQSHESDEKVVV